MDQWLVQLGIATIPAALGYLGLRATNRTKVKTSTGPEWKSYADSLRDDMNAYRDELNAVRERLSALEKDHRLVLRKYDLATEYIGDLAMYVPEGRELPRPHPMIADDLP